MAPAESAQESLANKRKREMEEQGKRKRTKRGRSQLKPNSANGQKDADEKVIETNGAGSSPKNEGHSVADAAPASPNKKKESKRQRSKQEKHLVNNQASDKHFSKWRISRPMGGRILDIDPILTADEKHLILAYNTSLQIYSAADSLLLRKIHIPLLPQHEQTEQIVSACLSPTSPNLLWVASSIGRVWALDWTLDDDAQSCFNLDCDSLTGMSVDRVEIGNGVQDVLFVSVKDEQAWAIVACSTIGASLDDSKIVFSHPIPDDDEITIVNVQSVQFGRTVAASWGNDLIIGTSVSRAVSTFGDLEYEFFTLDCSDLITCLDVRVSDRIHLSRKSERAAGDEPVVNVAVGCARGSISVYDDLIPSLKALASLNGRRESLKPRILHWHRKAVHAVKWSRDGNYLLSGGSESTLVMWQMDTGRKDFLPHLSASIENIVVSARGSAYAIHLDDNSAMVLSTTEMKPTTYVSGVQSIVSPHVYSKDDLVWRVSHQRNQDKIMKTPAVVYPSNPSRMMLCVGNGQQSSHSGNGPSTPLIQTIDLGTIHSISKQALARTNPTDINMTSKGFAISEPRITHMSFSQDGTWLATADEWQPPARDVESLDGPSTDRREIYLKFWAVNREDQSLELVSRVNAPHFVSQSEPIYDLASDPSSHRFATVGVDGMVRLWRPTFRQRDGVFIKGKQGQKLQGWSCYQSVSVHGSEISAGFDVSSSRSSSRGSGSLCFSDDGSLLVCAVANATGESTAYIIDTESGKVRHTLHGLANGDIQGIQLLSSQLVVLSDSLVVYDLVLDEMVYGIQLRDIEPKAYGPSISAHLAVDRQTSTFAVAVSRARHETGPVRSELAIFTTERSEPEMIQTFPHPISTVVPAVSSSGFLVLDCSAQLWSVSQGTENESAFAQPLADLKLDTDEIAQAEDSGNGVAVLNGDDDEPMSEDEMEIDVPEDDAMEDEVYQAVVPQQKLTELFDAAPAFAMPPIEDMFYQVAQLFAPKAPTIDS